MNTKMHSMYWFHYELKHWCNIAIFKRLIKFVIELEMTIIPNVLTNYEVKDHEFIKLFTFSTGERYYLKW